MTHPKELIKGEVYRLPGEEFQYFEYFKKSDGSLGRRPIFMPALFSGKATYNGGFDLGDERTHCNACHRRIRRGYLFTDDEGVEFHFGRAYLKNHVGACGKLSTEAEK